MSISKLAPWRLVLLVALPVLLAACGSTPKDESVTGGYEDQGTTIMDDEGGATAVGAGDEAGLSGGSVDQDGFAANLPRVFYFDFDQATLSTEIRAVLDAHASALRESMRSVRLEGHADERGTREYNLALGERRAKAVANYLVLQGVDRARIETVSYGEERPASLGHDEDAWAMNRRVELK